ncbi:GFA family protein [Sphingomonas sp. TX0522]|jgi:hypothetical protein|uniref:GFA family protein n=1 Tax=Sphingomonas sp. TX0522 TaxID=2479205 RepID=UPI0018DF298B|nr:GFA family protein [Sphingomonas sp. TX0522]
MAIEGSCHCGKVRFQAPVPEQITQCNCTYCDRVGALWAYCPPDSFTLQSDATDLLTYAPNAGSHFSCSTCGMVTHGRSPDYENPAVEKMSYNVRMALGFDRSAVPIIELDGRHQW